MRARLSSGYQPKWDVDLAYGRKGEEWVANYLGALVLGEPGHLTAEAKRDRQWLNTGNIWIEVACKRADGWHDSGVVTSEADMWTLLLGECVLVGVPTRVLRRIAVYAWDWADDRGRNRFRSEEKDGSHPTRGVRLELGWFLMRLRIELFHDLQEAVA